MVSPYGNVGRTTTIAGLGAVLAYERDDPIIAVDASDGALRRHTPTHNTRVDLRHLAARVRDSGSGIGEFTFRAASGLEILADDAGATAPGEPLDPVSYSALLTALNSYGVVLSDCPTGVGHLTTFVALTGSDQHVFVSSLSESSIAATVDALATYRYLADRSHVVLTDVRGGGTSLDAREAAEQVAGACRSVVVVPFDEQLAHGGLANLEHAREATWEAYRELAAVLARGFPHTKNRRVDEPDAAHRRPGAGGPYLVSSPTPLMPPPDGLPAEPPTRPPYLRERHPRVVEPPSTEQVPPPEVFAAPDSRDDPQSTGYVELPRVHDSSSGLSPHAPSQNSARQGSEAPPTAPVEERTPLYDALAADWFQARQDQRPGDGLTPASQRSQTAPTSPQGPVTPAWRGSANDDLGGQADRIRRPSAGGVTPSGLPRRVPRADMASGGARQQPSGPQISRAPEDVRGRLSSLRRKTAQGRQAGTDPSGRDGSSMEPGRSGADGAVGHESTLGGSPASAAPSYRGDAQQSTPPQTSPVAPVRPQDPPWASQAPSPMRGFPVDEEADFVDGVGAAPQLAAGGGATGPSQRGEPALGMGSASAWSWQERQPAPSGGAEGLSEPHHLVAELAEQAAPDREVPLHVQITREPWAHSARMRSFLVPEGGTRLTITVTAQGLRALGDLTQELIVYPGSDSDVLYFGLRTMASGLHQVTVRAFHQGTYLGAVHLQISVTEGGVTRDGPRRRAVLPGIAFEPGEATLQVHRAEDGSFSFQLLSETCYPPELFRYRGGDPSAATEQIYDQLREAATRAGGASPASAAALRKRLKNEGVQLWSSAVPEAVQRQFWEQADRITSFTVLGEHDFVPWELLYPLDKGHDNGFLAEWLPVVRRVFRQDRVHRIAVPGAAFVMPPDSPAEARVEIAELRNLLGRDVVDAGLFTEREALTDLVESGHAGLLHFACHNGFSRSGSRVRMADGHFTPRDLATAAQTGSLRDHQPLVFFNACRSAGEIPWFSDTLGWAQTFLKAGAGAFIGTLWPVRSDSAMQFAKAFYGQLLDGGMPLGQASLAARRATRDLDGDPTWLAYAVYGSPAATATSRAPT
ncbi:CHAT domain-containing protein [Streptomyces sp. NPDC005017]|uniref:CHAT domain-containing protein n=1 Tax=Streptomyces sp. NPDC005017 TaxID=3364706 RepID=UPI003678F734